MLKHVDALISIALEVVGSFVAEHHLFHDVPLGLFLIQGQFRLLGHLGPLSIEQVSLTICRLFNMLLDYIVVLHVRVVPVLQDLFHFQVCS